MIQFAFILLLSLLFGTSVSVTKPRSNYYRGYFDLVPGRIYWGNPRQWGGDVSIHHPIVVLDSDIFTDDWGVIVVEITHWAHDRTIEFKPLKDFFDPGTLMPPPWGHKSAAGDSIDNSIINVQRAQVLLAFPSVIRRAAFNVDMKPDMLKWLISNIVAQDKEQLRPPWLALHGPVRGMNNYAFEDKFIPNSYILDKSRKEPKLQVQRPTIKSHDSKYYKGKFDLVPGRFYWVSQKAWGGKWGTSQAVVLLGSDTLTDGWGVIVVETTRKESDDTVFEPLKEFYDAGTLIPPPYGAVREGHESPVGIQIEDNSVINVGQARVVLAFPSVIRKAAWDVDMKPEKLRWIISNIEDLNKRQSRPTWLYKRRPVRGMDNYNLKDDTFVMNDKIREKFNTEPRLTVVHTDTSTATCELQGGNQQEESSCDASAKGKELTVIPLDESRERKGSSSPPVGGQESSGKKGGSE